MGVEGKATLFLPRRPWEVASQKTACAEMQLSACTDMLQLLTKRVVVYITPRTQGDGYK